MKVIDDIYYVTGRGNIVITEKEEDNPIHINDKLKISDNVFEVVGIEQTQYSKVIGLILRPNDIVKEIIKKGDKISAK